MTMGLYIDISELAPSQSDGDPREQSMVSLTLLDPNGSGLGAPQSKAAPSFSITLPRNSLPELFLRMYYKFREMDDDSLRELEHALLDGPPVTSSGRTFPKWLERVRNILEQRFAEPFKLSEIAAEAGVHPVHLAREFRKHYGTSVGEYVRRVRIEYACRELMGSNAAVTNIAFAAGFADQSHFSRTFKRLCGTTPGRYRASIVRS
ncbi:MAG: AraC family transcriptional regulator [Acidobacteriota bacterium]|jgi:AraC family transcriptional regulator